MTRFRPCIDLHQGRVKQIVGGTLRDDGPGPRENFVAEQSAAWFADRYQQDQLLGGHVIKLGPGNEQAAREALSAYRGGLQIGGGMTAENAIDWLDAGATHVIVTSWLFNERGRFQPERLKTLSQTVGPKRLVIDLSCRRLSDGRQPRWTVAMNRWQTLTDLEINADTLGQFAEAADELLVHAADVEGLCQGIDAELVAAMGNWAKMPMTYAGGVASMKDVQLVDQASSGKVDVTVGGALDLFGGSGVRYEELIRWNQQH